VGEVRWTSDPKHEVQIWVSEMSFEGGILATEHIRFESHVMAFGSIVNDAVSVASARYV